MLKIGVTGITGGFGRSLSELLLKQGVKVRALVRKDSNLQGLSPHIELMYGDVRDSGSLPGFIEGIDVCIHLAAQVRYSTKRELYDTNIKGTDNLCKAVLADNTNCRLIHCSTISVLKVNPVFRFLSSPYAISKYLAEKRVLYYMKRENLRATIIYPGLIYGNHDRSFLPQIIGALKGGGVRFFKGGERNAPLIHSDELAHLFLRAAMNSVSDGKRYISVKGIELGIHDVVKYLAEKTNSVVPDKIHSKTLYFIFALCMEALFRICKKDGKPALNRTVVDVLSINYDDYKKSYDDPLLDLGWAQNTTREYFERNISEIMAHRVKNQTR